MAAGPVGIIANPASGKDIRRLVAHASVFDNQEKRSIVRRVLLGAVAGGATGFRYMPDPHLIVEQAIEDAGIEGEFEPVASPRTGSALDTTRSATAMREADCRVLVTLGGDGTNRAAVLGWPDAPLVAVSTGTNNVFPRLIEATVAGAAAGLVASGRIGIEEVGRQAKTVTVEIEGEAPDLALIDAVLVEGPFVGARAIWQPGAIHAAVLARAEPAAVGISAVGGLLHPVSTADDGGLWFEAGAGGPEILAPIAPGLFAPVPIRDLKPLALGEPAHFEGPGVIALDGERERVLKRGQRATLRVLRNGPRVVDVDQTLKLAACRELFRLDAAGGADGH